MRGREAGIPRDVQEQMAMATTRLLTVGDVEESPPEGEWELIDGELCEVTLASYRSSKIASRISRILGVIVDAHNLGDMTGADGGYVPFPDRNTILAPDTAFVRKDRIPAEHESARFPRLAPDLAIEVLSPSDRASEVVAKLEMYQEAGIPLIWLVDPEKKTNTVIASGKPTQVLGMGDTIDGGDVVPGFSDIVAHLVG
jgi:Uma2 family endonuclease